MNNCDRCKDWQEQGLSDTCPSCDLGNELDARRELISAKVTLNGKPAVISGVYDRFANVFRVKTE